MAEQNIADGRRLTRLQCLGVAALFVFGGLMVIGFVFVFSGTYNIAARDGHWSITNAVLTAVRDRSISVAAEGINVPDLSDQGLVRLGKEHYKGACATCHGGLGKTKNPVYQSMLPEPPDLTYAFEDYSASEVFWIIYNGLKFTGMPAWPGNGRTDEVWPVVAYLRDAQRGAEATVAANEEKPPLLGVDLPGAESVLFESCARCHGGGSTGPVSNLVPSLNGLSVPYLVRSLQEYRTGNRQSGIMQPIAHELSDKELTELALYYSNLPPVPFPRPAPGDRTPLGEEIARSGLPSEDVPACSSCHNGSNPNIPVLDGQSAEYMLAQLELWREQRARGLSAYGSIMAVVGQRLTPQQAIAVSQYYASLPVLARAAP